MTLSPTIGAELSLSAYEAWDLNDIEANLREAVMLEQLRREQQRKRMVKYRIRKKERVDRILQERRRLEVELKSRHSTVRKETNILVRNKQWSVFVACPNIAKEVAALTRENLALQDALEEQNKLRKTVERDLSDFVRRFLDPYEPRSPTEPGWCVYFQNYEPSFYFHPFSKAKYDAVFKHYDDLLVSSDSSFTTVGTMFGWTVEYAPLVPSPLCDSFLAQARFTRRLRCPLINSGVEYALDQLDRRYWPQKFPNDAYVFVCNIPGQMHLRYFTLVRHFEKKSPDGRRVLEYGIVVVDSDNNARNRDAEQPQDNVQWVLEGGCFLTPRK